MPCMRPVRPSRRVSLPAEALLTFAHKRRSIALSWKVMRLLVRKSFAAHSSFRHANSPTTLARKAL
jgi:hypothetical protein